MDYWLQEAQAADSFNADWTIIGRLCRISSKKIRYGRCSSVRQRRLQRSFFMAKKIKTKKLKSASELFRSVRKAPVPASKVFLSKKEKAKKAATKKIDEEIS
jgi:hypothetical protein